MVRAVCFRENCPEGNGRVEANKLRIYSVTQVRKKWMSELGWWWGGGKERNERYIKGGKWPGKVIGWDSGSTDYGELVIIKHGLYQRKEPSWISIVWEGALEMMKQDLSSQWQRIYTLVQEWVRWDPQWKILSGENLVGITEMILDPVALRITSNKGTVDMRCCWSTTYFPIWKQSPFFTVKQEQLTTLLPWPPEWANNSGLPNMRILSPWSWWFVQVWTIGQKRSNTNYLKH